MSIQQSINQAIGTAGIAKALISKRISKPTVPEPADIAMKQAQLKVQARVQRIKQQKESIGQKKIHLLDQYGKEM